MVAFIDQYRDTSESSRFVRFVIRAVEPIADSATFTPSETGASELPPLG